MKKWSSIFTIVLLLALFVTACGVLNVNVSGGKITVTVTLQEQQVNDLLKQSIVRNNYSPQDRLLNEITSMDFIEPDTIRVHGTRQNTDGTSVNGSVDIKFSAEQNTMKTQVAAVNIPGLDMNSEVVKQANDDMTQAFNKSALQNNPSDSGIKSAKIVGKTLEIVVEANTK